MGLDLCEVEKLEGSNAEGQSISIAVGWNQLRSANTSSGGMDDGGLLASRYSTIQYVRQRNIE